MAKRERGTATGAPDSAPGHKRTLEEKQADLERKRWAEVTNRFCHVIEETAVDRVITYAESFEGQVLERVTIVMAISAQYGHDALAYADGHMKNDVEFWKLLTKGYKLSGALAWLWENVREKLSHDISYVGPTSHFNLDNVEIVRGIARTIGFDIEGLYKDVCGEKGFGVPKAWAAEISAAEAKTKDAAEKPTTEPKSKKGKKVKSAEAGKAPEYKKATKSEEER